MHLRRLPIGSNEVRYEDETGPYYFNKVGRAKPDIPRIRSINLEFFGNLENVEKC